MCRGHSDSDARRGSSSARRVNSASVQKGSTRATATTVRGLRPASDEGSDEQSVRSAAAAAESERRAKRSQSVRIVRRSEADETSNGERR